MSIRIRVMATPPGDVPFEIRDKWVGVELPIAPEGKRTIKVIDIANRPDGTLPPYWKRLLYALLGRTYFVAAYCLPAQEALAILAASQPEAAAWWRTNRAWLVDENPQLVFREEDCAVIEDQGFSRAGREPR